MATYVILAGAMRECKASGVLADENEEYEIYLNNPNTELSIKEFDKRKQEFVDVDLQQLWEYTDKINNYKALVKVGVTTDDGTLKFVTLHELQPYHWTKAYPADELEHFIKLDLEF